MMLFASWIKHPFNVPVQRPHDADPRSIMKSRPSSGRDQDADRPPACSSLVSHVGTARRDLFEIRIVIKD
jgi:hypothetical protein